MIYQHKTSNYVSQSQLMGSSKFSRKLLRVSPSLISGKQQRWPAYIKKVHKRTVIITDLIHYFQFQAKLLNASFEQCWTVILRTTTCWAQINWAFEKKTSTEDLLLHMIEKWHLALDDGKSIDVLFINYQKAFDSVSLFYNKLSACGISCLLYEYIRSYLRNRSQYTVLNRVKSEEKSVWFGAPQGSILGPNLFSVFVNGMPQKS